MDRFERAVEAVIDGDVAALRQLLAADPSLVHARSTRVPNGNPPVHGATLLHYLAANGVEDERQRSPQNAVDVAKVLLSAGADPESLVVPVSIFETRFIGAPRLGGRTTVRSRRSPSISASSRLIR